MVNFGPPVPWAQMDYNQTPRKYLMKNKDEIMDMIRLTGGDPSEQDFMEAAQAGIHDFKDWKKWMDSGKMHKGESLHGNVKVREHCTCFGNRHKKSIDWARLHIKIMLLLPS